MSEILYTAEEVAEFIVNGGSLYDLETMTQDEIASALDDHRDHMLVGGAKFGVGLSEHDAGDLTQIRDASAASMTFDDVRYAVVASKSADGVTNVKLISDPPPRGLDRIRYEWTGRLVGGPRPS